MAAHGQDGSKIDAIAKFDKKQLKAFDQKTFSDILAEIRELKTRYWSLKGRFELGYTIVCNSDLSITFDERNTNEVAFFTLDPWSSIPKERAGIAALKHRLNNLLVNVTRRSFQGVAVDIRRRIGKLAQQLQIIGPVRQTAFEQRNYLINIASKFREITTKAIDAYYSRDECFEMDDIFRLATLIMEMNEDFLETVHKKGFT
ncbi:MAG: hypothetical protein M4579_007505 [Chaenotheca gracillima]|nr:MAG: hypothetical protein M4579_007505 [Chaenotheca gracillima]